MRTLSGCLIAATFLINPLLAQEKTISSETSFYVRTAAGNPAVCGFDAILVFRDHTYQNGRLAGVRASLEWLEDRGNIGLLLKVTGVDFPNADKQDMTGKPFRIDHALLVVDGNPLQPANANRCEEPKAFCGGYWIPASLAIKTALVARKLSIAFNRETNGLDIDLPIDPADSIRRKPEEFQNYTDCNAILAQRAVTNLRR